MVELSATLSFSRTGEYVEFATDDIDVDEYKNGDDGGVVGASTSLLQSNKLCCNHRRRCSDIPCPGILRFSIATSSVSRRGDSVVTAVDGVVDGGEQLIVLEAIDKIGGEDRDDEHVVESSSQIVDVDGDQTFDLLDESSFGESIGDTARGIPVVVVVVSPFSTKIRDPLITDAANEPPLVVVVSSIVTANCRLDDAVLWSATLCRLELVGVRAVTTLSSSSTTMLLPL